MARQTNVDVVASKLTAGASAHDLIVVIPWYFGTSFDRYYHGRADWQSVPPLAHYRFDFVRNMVGAAQDKQTIEPDLKRMSATLQAGGRVLIVGELPSEQELRLRSAANRDLSHLDQCVTSWYSQIRGDLRNHSILVSSTNTRYGPEINEDETAGVDLGRLARISAVGANRETSCNAVFR